MLKSRPFASTSAFFADREYFRQLLRFSLPIAVQSLVTNALQMVGVVLIGQLGEVPVAAVGLGNQVFFLLNLMLFGITSGSAIFTAQLWGKQDLANIRRVVSLCLLLSCGAGLLFFCLAIFTPGFVIGIYSADPAVIAAGSSYLRIFGMGFLFFAVTMTFSIVLRSTGDVRTPMLISTSALALNILLSYVLIFGKLGLPAMGVGGAALAALIARMLECSAIVITVYRERPMVAVHPKDFLRLNLDFVRRVFKPILPVILNETFWSFGTTAYFVVYAHISTASLAAMNIVSTIDNLAFVVVFGVSHSTAIMVGNRIGAGEKERAYQFAGRSLILGVLVGLFIGSQVLLWSPFILDLYKVPDEVIELARRVLLLVACFQWIRGFNAVVVVGVLRSGGDTRFSFVLDGLIIWIVGVPMAIFSAFVLKLPVYWVYLFVMSEETLKCLFGLQRYLSRKWINDFTGKV